MGGLIVHSSIHHMGQGRIIIMTNQVDEGRIDGARVQKADQG